MDVTVKNITMDGLIDKYTVLGYIFGFAGILAIFDKLFVALLFGFAGGLGGWVFEKIKNSIEKYLKSKKLKEQEDGQDKELID